MEFCAENDIPWTMDEKWMNEGDNPESQPLGIHRRRIWLKLTLASVPTTRTWSVTTGSTTRSLPRSC